MSLSGRTARTHKPRPRKRIFVVLYVFMLAVSTNEGANAGDSDARDDGVRHLRTYGRDTNENGLYDELVIEAEFFIDVPGSHAFSLWVETCSRRTIDSVYVPVEASAPGWIPAKAVIPARNLRRAGQDGPYRIWHMQLLRTESGRATVLRDWWDMDIETEAYRLRQFERPPIQLTDEASLRPLDDDHNGKLDAIVARLGVDVVYPGMYQAGLSLRGACGQQVRAESKRTRLNGQANDVLVFLFDGKKIGALSMDGPYGIDDLIIWGPIGDRRESTARKLEPKAEPVTEYVATDFEGYQAPPDCNGNGVNDLCALLAGDSVDKNANRIPDECENTRAPEHQLQNAPPTIEQLFAKATDPDVPYSERRSAVDAMGQHSEHPRQAVDALIHVLNQSDTDLHGAALTALVAYRDLDGFAASALPEALSRIGAWHKDYVRIAACDVLTAIGPAARDGVANLVDALNARNNALRTRAMDALGAIGPGAAAALPTLERIASSDSPDAHRAANTIGQIVYEPEAQVPQVPRGLEYALMEGRRLGRERTRKRLHQATNEPQGDSAPAMPTSKPEGQLRIIVTAPNGRPIEHARVVVFPESKGANSEVRWQSAKFATTDDLGACYFEKLHEGRAWIAAVAEDYAVSRASLIYPHFWSENIVLASGLLREFRVIDPDGAPIEGATIDFSESYVGLLIDPPVVTDSAGVFAVRMARDVLYARIVKPGFMPYHVMWSPQLETGPVITLCPPYRISGRVTDAVTGKRIPKFEAYVGHYFLGVPPLPSSERDEALLPSVIGRDGTFELAFTKSVQDMKLLGDRVVAVVTPGYFRGVSEPFTDREGDRTLEFKLQPSAPVRGTVGWSGAPIVGADVYLRAFNVWQPLELHNGRVTQPGKDVLVTKTDDAGRFEFPAQQDRFGVLVVHDRGFAVLYSDETNAPAELELSPWARVAGQAFLDGATDAGATVVVSAARQTSVLNRRPEAVGPNSPRDELQLVVESYEATTGVEGKFEFDRVVPGSVRVFHNVGHLHIGASAIIDIAPGQFRRVKLESSTERNSVPVEGA